MTGKKRTDEYLALALSGGEELLRKRTVTTMGVRFPAEPYPGKEEIRYEFKLYDGSAGIGITLLDLFQATGDSRYADLCEEVSRGLIESTPEYGLPRPGLYGGFCGVALFHLAYARILRKRDALERAIEMGIRLGQNAYADTDLLGGAAGSGLLQIILYYATRDPVFRSGARAAYEFLAETAIASGDQVAWLGRDPKQPLTSTEESYVELATQIHNGLAHGVAGVCLFLVELAQIIGDPPVIQLYEKGFRWLEGKAMKLRKGLVWTRSETNRMIQNHWCHGSAGIAHAYLALYRHKGEARILSVAEAAGEATWDAVQTNDEEPTCHCHGISGAIDLFLELDNHCAEKLWRRRAFALANRLKQCVKKDAKEGAANALGGKGTGLGLGTAGIVRQLLRLSDYSIFPILKPSQEQVTLKPDPSATGRRRKRIGKKQLKSTLQFPVRDLVPRAGIRFANADHFVVIGSLEEENARKILNQIEESPAGIAYFRSLDQIIHACERLRAKYTHRMEPSAVDPSVLGGLLREIAGMTLRDAANPKIVKQAASRMTRNAIAALELLFERLDADFNGVLSSEIDGRLKRVKVRGSDPHRGGQRLVELQFEEGPLLLYKARPIAIDQELAGASKIGEPATLSQRCREWLQPSVPGGLLPTHRLLPASAWHGYAEAISTETRTMSFPEDLLRANESTRIPPPEVARLSEGDEKRYWYSAGLLAGHAFTLSIQDLHAENVICGKSGSTPDLSLHAIDLEMAFGNAIDLEDTHLIDGPRWNNEPRKHSHAAFDFVSDFACALYAEDWVIELTQDGPTPVSRPYQASRWIFPHLVQNPDGSFGYEGSVCSFLRGFADQWSMLQARAREVNAHLHERLQGSPMRVVLNPTRSYAAPIINRKFSGSPIPGIAINPAFPFARRLFPAEIKQLNDLDIPYFFRFLEEDRTSQSPLYWFEPKSARPMLMKDFPPIRHESSFSSIVERQADPNRLARAVVDIAWAAAPAGPFDFHDPVLGVRLVRTSEDKRFLVVLLLGEKRDQRLTCRVAPEGQIDWWLD